MFTLRPLGCRPVMDVSLCGRFPPLPSDAAGLFHAATFPASQGSAPPAWFGPPFDPSVARGVFQPTSATVLRLLSVFPASL
jgi:hypothetical protein